MAFTAVIQILHHILLNFTVPLGDLIVDLRFRLFADAVSDRLELQTCVDPRVLAFLQEALRRFIIRFLGLASLHAYSCDGVVRGVQEANAVFGESRRRIAFQLRAVRLCCHHGEKDCYRERL